MPSVLIIDDEPNIRRMVGALLSAEGYEVRDAPDGASGIARAIETDPDVLLLDLMMPGELDGMATLARLRDVAPDLPVIMMSGRAGLADAVKATKLGSTMAEEKDYPPVEIPDAYYVERRGFWREFERSEEMRYNVNFFHGRTRRPLLGTPVTPDLDLGCWNPVLY